MRIVAPSVGSRSRPGQPFEGLRPGRLCGPRKSDASPVTEADELADAIITRGLAAAFPEIPIVTEEQQASHGLSAPVFFLVDPLDGTKEFVQRRGDFTVNIALIENGCRRAAWSTRPPRGASSTPTRPATHRKRQGRTATSRAPDAAHRRHARPCRARRRRLEVHRYQATDDYIARYRVADFRSAGSSLKFCLVAAGEADLYPRLGRTMEWDTAAGQAVLLGAGGRVVCFDGHAPLAYGKDGFENPHFIAHAPGVALLRD